MKSLTWKRTTDWYRTLQDVWSRWPWTKKLMEPELNLHYPARTYHFLHHNLHDSSCASCPASQSAVNWLIARGSYVGRREPAAGVAKGGYGRERGGYNARSGFLSLVTRARHPRTSLSWALPGTNSSVHLWCASKLTPHIVLLACKRIWTN